tara:strand:- start:6340 stop:7086 length:747 start_codon:yes stop_codon:yes gene_type:complete
MQRLLTKEQILDDALHLFQSGWTSNVIHFNFLQFNQTPFAFQELYIDLLGEEFVSKPCWRSLLASSVEQKIIIRRNKYDYVIDFPKGNYECFRFIFNDVKECTALAMKVQKSATNKRKNSVRQARLKASEGFYDNTVLKQLNTIQCGKCYYSGELLSKENTTIDHLVPLCEGGSQWPVNLVLCTIEMNRKKGGALDPYELVDSLSKIKGEVWAKHQVAFMLNVDEQRFKLDRDFKTKHSVIPNDEDYL